jgi:hypothetical protein
MVSLAVLGGACLALPGAASAQVVFNNNAINNCLTPGVTQYMVGDGISQGLSFRPCPNVAAPTPVVAAPAPVETPAPVAETPAPAPEETPAPVAYDTPAPVPVYTPPPPPQRIPVTVPTYSPWSTTNGPGANAVGGGNGTASYYNPYGNVSPTSRAAVNSGDWCRRNGRSTAAMDACLKSVAGR